MAKPDFGWMIRTSKSHESMQGPGTVDVFTAEAGGGRVWERVMGRSSHFTGHVSPHAAAGHVCSPALCRPGMSNINELGDW